MSTPPPRRGLDLQGDLARRMTPVLLVLVAVVAVSAPTAYHLVRVGEIRARGELVAEELAHRLRVEARARPRLWSYDSTKVLDHLRAFRLQEDLRALRVYDRAGRLVARRTQDAPGADGPLVWSRATIGDDRGQVWVAMSVAHSRAVAMLLLMPFLVLGIALAAALHLLPRSALGQAGTRIDQLIGALESARDRLAARGDELEGQVADRVRDLRRAYDELRDRDERLRELSGRAVALQEADRRAIARDLHDAAGQTLTAVRLNLQLLEQQAESPRRVRAQVAATLGQVDTVMEEVRRAVWALGPALVHELGIAEALRRHCQTIAEQSDLHVVCEVAPAIGAPGPAVETVCYRLVQEALTNVVRHADASEVVVMLAPETRQGVEHLVLQVRDDGQGFERAPEQSAVDRRGLSGMHERLELLGGELTVESHCGAGTTLRAWIPIEPSAPRGAEDREGLRA